MRIILTGRVPSKKNSTLSFVRGGRVLHIPSNKYREWHKDVSSQLKQFPRPQSPLEKADVSIVLFAPDRRAGDLSNKAESVMDLLVDNGFLSDDNWFVVGNLSLVFGGVDKTNPRVEIKVSPAHI